MVYLESFIDLITWWETYRFYYYYSIFNEIMIELVTMLTMWIINCIEVIICLLKKEGRLQIYS